LLLIGRMFWMRRLGRRMLRVWSRSERFPFVVILPIILDFNIRHKLFNPFPCPLSCCLRVLYQHNLSLEDILELLIHNLQIHYTAFR
jgi:hypothetical protein